MNSAEFLETLLAIYSGTPLPKPLSMALGVSRVLSGESIDEIRRDLRTTRARLQAAVDAPDPIAHILGIDPVTVSEKGVSKAAIVLGQLLLGRAAEIAFESLYRDAMATHEFELKDHRTSRSGTDYRVHNGGGRPLYRLNIKFHGSRFKRAAELVGLDPEDCFALATYKIKNALDKQDEEHLPYIFAIVGVPNLTGAAVAGKIPGEMASLVAICAEAPRVERVRDIEDQVIDRLASKNAAVFTETLQAITTAPWYVLSARRAAMLLKEKLFERVYAMRVRGFAQQFRSAELDMHFSLSQDLTKLTSFFDTLKAEGQTKVASLLERGSM